MSYDKVAVTLDEDVPRELREVLRVGISDALHQELAPRPNPKTVCLGRCEGMGFYPMQCTCRGETIGHRPDEMTGWCFVNCADCGGTHTKRGTGKRS